MAEYLYPQGGLTGKIRDATTNLPMSDVTMYLDADISTVALDPSTADGRFEFTTDVGDVDLVLVKAGYRTRRIPVSIQSFRYPVRVYKMYKTRT